MLETRTNGSEDNSHVACPPCEPCVSYDRSDGPLPWRVFINHVDTYQTSRIADMLLDKDWYPSAGSSSSSLAHEGEGEESDEQEPDGTKGQQEEAPREFELIVTVQDNEFTSEDMTVIRPYEDDKEAFLAELLQCGFIIYDITSHESQIDEAIWLLNELASYLEQRRKKGSRAFKTRTGQRHFILVSNVMSWASTKPTRGGEPLTEAEYRRRRPHRGYKRLIECEREVVGLGRRNPRLADHLRTLVLCSGLTYGYEQHLLHYAFKLGWSNESWLPVLGPGHNSIPLLHVLDLASAVYAVMRNWPKIQYVVAVERKPTTQENLLKALSKALSTGRVKSISVDEALSIPDVTEQTIDAITLDLHMFPTFLAESPYMAWQSDSSFCERIESIVDEYRFSRNLQPVRLIIVGPPAVGKTMIAQMLAKHYHLHYISLAELIPTTIQELRNEIEDSKGEKENGVEENDEGDEDNVRELEATQTPQGLLDEIMNGLDENNGRLKDEQLTKIVKRRLLSKACRNQGYVMDGYPKTLEQARLLFGSDEPDLRLEDDEEEEETATVGAYENVEEQKALEPDFVICLDASDDFLVERVISLPERQLQGTHYTEEHMLRRLHEYRNRNEDDKTPLQLFDEKEKHPVVIDVEEDDPLMTKSLEYCINIIGSPNNYGPSREEIEEAERKAEAKAVAEAALAAIQRDREKEELRRQSEKRAVEWTCLLDQLKLEEEERLCIMAEPLRHYLVKNVFPSLTQGLIEVAKLRPCEPIDYLAEYLLRENPEGRQFEPDYTESLRSTLDGIAGLQELGLLAAASSPQVFEHASSAQQDEGEADADEPCPCCPPIEYRTVERMPGPRDESSGDEADECHECA